MENLKIFVGLNNEETLINVLDFMIESGECPRCKTKKEIIDLHNGSRTPWFSAFCTECNTLFGFEDTEDSPCFHVQPYDTMTDEEFNSIFHEMKIPTKISVYANTVKKMLIGN